MDARGLRRSEQHGKPIALARRRSAFTHALTGLLDELFLPSTSPRAKRRKRRLVAPPDKTPSTEREEVVWQR